MRVELRNVSKGDRKEKIKLKRRKSRGRKKDEEKQKDNFEVGTKAGLTKMKNEMKWNEIKEEIVILWEFMS